MSPPGGDEPPAPTPVVLEGRLVRLEPLTAGHADAIVEVALEPSIWRWTVEDIAGPEQLRAHLDRALAAARAGDQLPFVTVERAGGRIVGATRFMAIEPAHRRLEIGWTWLARAWRGRGLNDEAKLLQLSHAFGVLGCRRVEFKTDALNERSRAALLAIGATFEGVFRKHMVSQGGRARDSAWYSIIDDEWPQVEARLRARVEASLAGRTPLPGGQETEMTR